MLKIQFQKFIRLNNQAIYGAEKSKSFRSNEP